MAWLARHLGWLFDVPASLAALLALALAAPLYFLYGPAPSGRIESVRTPGQFSIWRSRLLDRIPWWSHLLLAVTALLLAVQAVRNRWRPVDTAALFLLLWVTAQFGVAVLGEGFVNVHQHLLGARRGLDLLLVLSVARLAAAAAAGCRITARPPSGASA